MKNTAPDKRPTQSTADRDIHHCILVRSSGAAGVIPSEQWVDNPAEFFTNYPTWNATIFGGDDRGFDRDGSHRTSQRISITRFGLRRSKTSIGRTTLYDKASSLDSQTPPRLVAGAKTDTSLGDGHWLVAVATARDQGVAGVQLLSASRVRVTAGVAAGNPLISIVPANNIDYLFEIVVDFSSPTVKYSIEGAHDAFPNYEVYINRQRIHHFAHAPDATPAVLFPPNDDVTVSHADQELTP